MRMMGRSLRAGGMICLFFCALVLGAVAAGTMTRNEIIAYSAQGEGVADIYLIDAVGGSAINVTRSVSASDRMPIWSPDGAHLLFERTNRSSIQACVITPGITHEPTCTTNEAASVKPLRWHPTSTFFFADVLTPHDVFIVNAETGTILQPAPYVSVGVLATTRDFRFGLTYSTEYSQHLSRFTLQPASQPQELVIGAQFSGRPAFSPDGLTVAFGATWLGEADLEIYTVDALSGANAIQLTENDRLDLSPTYSPDGRQIAFISDRHFMQRDSTTQLYVMNADGSNVRRLTFADMQHGEPAWKP